MANQPSLATLKQWDAEREEKNRKALAQAKTWDRENMAKHYLSDVGHGIENIIGGAANPIINTANLLPEAASWLTEKAIGKKNVFPDIPNIPTQPGLMTDVGNIAGFLVPGSAAVKGIEAATDIPRALMGAKDVAQEAKRIAPAVERLATSTGAGTLAGGAASPEGARESGMMYGAAGGAAGHVLSNAVSAIPSAIKNAGIPEAASRYLSKVADNLPFRSDEAVNKEMATNIGQNYVDAVNKSVPLYQKVFNKNPSLMEKSDFPNYTKALKSMADVNSDKFYSPEGLIQESTGKIDPNDVHNYQSDLGATIRTIQNKAEDSPKIYQDAQKSLKKDLANHLEKNEKLDDYNEAQKLYATHTAPYAGRMANNKISPMRAFKSALNAPRGENGLKELSENNPLKEGISYNDVIPAFIEKVGKNPSNGTRLNYLTKMLGGDRDKAIEYTKHHLFKDTYNENTGKFDEGKFIKQYDKLTNVQRESLFSPMQEAQIQNIKRAHGIIKDNRTSHSIKAANHIMRGLSALGGLLTSIKSGGALPKDAASVALGYAVPDIVRTGTRKVAHAFLPETQEDLANYISPNKSPVIGSKIMRPSTIGAGTAVTISPYGVNNANK